MSAEQIISDWKKKQFKPVYWLEGDEPYYIDKLTKFAEETILPEDQVAFNLSIFYGKDSKIEEVINACRRYPMFHDQQVVIVKEVKRTITEITVLEIKDLPEIKRVEAITKELGIILLWEGEAYDAIGQWTDTDVINKLKSL